MKGYIGRWTRLESGPPLAGLTRVGILPGAAFSVSTLDVRNKIFAVVKDSTPLTVGSATNTTIDPTYADSPREDVVLVESGDAAFCNAVAASHLAIRQMERYGISNIPVRLRDGLQIQRGQRLRVLSPRGSIYGTFAVRRVAHDFSSNETLIDVGEFMFRRDDEGALVDIAKALAKLAKESAI